MTAKRDLFTFELPADLRRELVELARANGRSLGAELRIVLANHIRAAKAAGEEGK